MSAKNASPGDCDAIAIARRAFDEALATCAQRWRERWNRAPTTNELVNAFTICLSANPDDYVADVGPVLGKAKGTERAASPIDLEIFEVVFRDKGALGTEEVEFYLPDVEKKPGYGEVQAYLEIVADTLVVDVAFKEHGKVPRFDQACTLVRERALHRFIARKDAPIARVLLRPMSGLSNPVRLSWPPPSD
jgi:hypothetical protein